MHVLPTVWFRNTWSLGQRTCRARACAAAGRRHASSSNEPQYGRRWLLAEGAPELLFTENETNIAASVRLRRTARRYVKDGINDYVVHGDTRRGESGRARAPRRPRTIA